MGVVILYFIGTADSDDAQPEKAHETAHRIHNASIRVVMVAILSAETAA